MRLVPLSMSAFGATPLCGTFHLLLLLSPLSVLRLLLSTFLILLTSCTSPELHSLPSSTLIPFATSTRSPLSPTGTLQTPEVPADAKPQVQILTAIRLLPDDERYLPATINSTLVQVNADGRSARVNGQVLLPANSSAANQVWITGTAYDEAGRVVGVRRWESNDGLTAGGSLPFEFLVSSLGGRIERVDFAVEARP